MCWLFQWFTKCRHFTLRELSEFDMYKYRCQCPVVINNTRVQRVEGECYICELRAEGRIGEKEWQEELERMNKHVLEKGPDLNTIRVS
ncbi:hypothetical protein TWF569_009138 [Orbilia oligospora]|uniref:Uncharacterized protein n=1 Tax=Orbilia oligospora TaxID=2813651 RepID=A0A7C8P3W3_ORBOL|nr:hypothetical protein TWF103_004040 [Orbilia oligospora]KAF3082629.1 hypothetical protein TWF706_001625 [Orbilia oligospora]KAF3097713.1 hypothetical protein TWF102_006233 [Orbilia oligospora]KAF3130069.1 hypothetical protein TWF703_008408 [Orbilia oligospora]KAF3137693.1 hypothetical protein TWF569_009138 [Orbilia oligospora]